MTRCYEYYCLFACKDKTCKLEETDPITGKKKQRSGIFYIRKYITFMKTKGVHFDKSPEDKELFFNIVDEYGTEGQVTRNVHICEHEKSTGEPQANVICQDIRKINFRGASLVLTDPPYPKEYLPLWEILFEKAYAGLKESGLLVAYAPHIYLPAIFQFKNKLNYVWTIAQIHAGAKTSFAPSRVSIGWKPILVFVKGAMPEMDYFEDVLHGAGREKEDHEWQQAVAESEQLIQIFTNEQDLVVDPFVGSGTTAIAARNMKRNYLVYDNDPKAIEITNRRLLHGTNQ